MTTVRGFVYALEAASLVREWEWKHLRSELSIVRTAIAAKRGLIADLEKEMRASVEHATQSAQDGGTDVLDRFRISNPYLRLLAERRAGIHAALLDEEARHDVLLDQLIAAHRAVRVLEDHRGQQFNNFLNAQKLQEVREADDHWLVLSMHNTPDEGHIQDIQDILDIRQTGRDRHDSSR